MIQTDIIKLGGKQRMTLNNIKKMKNERGFTIVELLIVIVVIAILAAIVIVAYNGVQNRAKHTKAQTNAQTVVKKAEAYNAEEGVYPTLTQLDSAVASETYSIPDGISLLDGTTALTADNGETSVQYETCGTSPNFTGSRVTYYTWGTPDTESATAGTGC